MHKRNPKQHSTMFAADISVAVTMPKFELLWCEGPEGPSGPKILIARCHQCSIIIDASQIEAGCLSDPISPTH